MKMSQIKTFNEQLNASYNKTSHYNNWIHHRSEVSKNISNLPLANKDVLIIGVGNANDIELSIFKDCHRTVLLDIDLESVKLGIERQHLNQVFELEHYDLTGLGGTNFIQDYLESLEAHNDEKVLSDYKNIYTPYDLGAFDVVIVLPVYTQLLLPQLLPFIKEPEAVSRLLTFIAYRIQMLNNQLRSSLKDHGSLCLFSDVLEYETNSEEAKYLTAHTEHKILLEQHFQNYVTSYGHGLGSYGLEEMSGEIRPAIEDFLIWPFDDKRMLLVKFQIHK